MTVTGGVTSGVAFVLPASLDRLQKDLDSCGRIHVAFVCVNESIRLKNKLDRANKKIAALESFIAKRQLEQIYADL